LWGNEDVGLKHIIERREAQSIDAKAFLSDLADVIEKGAFYGKNNRGDFEFLYGKKMAVIAPTFKGNKLVFLLTAFKTNKK
jgi:hypothetical protein